MPESFFGGVPERIPFGGLDASDPLSFKVYNPGRIVLGKRMEDKTVPIVVCGAIGVACFVAAIAAANAHV